MNFNLEEIFKVSVVLFAVIDILGSIPIILDIKRKAGNIHAFKATFVSLIIMLLFLFFGENLISIFGIGVAEFDRRGFVCFVLSCFGNDSRSQFLQARREGYEDSFYCPNSLSNHCWSWLYDLDHITPCRVRSGEYPRGDHPESHCGLCRPSINQSNQKNCWGKLAWPYFKRCLGLFCWQSPLNCSPAMFKNCLISLSHGEEAEILRCLGRA